LVGAVCPEHQQQGQSYRAPHSMSALAGATNARARDLRDNQHNKTRHMPFPRAAACSCRDNKHSSVHYRTSAAILGPQLNRPAPPCNKSLRGHLPNVLRLNGPVTGRTMLGV
jgi:hypothetical protein